MLSPLGTSAAAVLALAVSGALAADAAVRSFPVNTGCSQFPGFSQGSDVTSPFLLQFVQSTAPINGNSVTVFNYYDDNKGRLAIPVATDLAKQPVRCNQSNASSNKGVPFFEILIAGGSWVPLQIFAPAVGADPFAGNAQLVFGAASNVSQLVRPYGHGASTAQGIFLGGADKSNRFASSVEFVSDDVHRSFYALRYVPTGGKIGNAEYTGFMQVQGV